MPNWWDSYAVAPNQGGGTPAPSPQPGTMNYYDSFARPPSTALPAAGDPTSFTGSSADGMTTPDRYDAGTMRALTLDMYTNGGKGSAAIIDNDPGQQYSRTYANTQAANQSNLDFKQKMTAPMIDTIEKLKQIGTQAGPDVLAKAIGPNYGQLSDDPNWAESAVKAPLPDTSGEFYQNARAVLQQFNPERLLPQSIKDAVGYTTPQSYVDARDLNNRLHHLVGGIGAGVKAIPGTKNGGTSTDSDQQLVLDTVGKALHSGNPQNFFAILSDAEDLIKGRSGQRGQAALPTANSYLPPQWSGNGSPTPQPGPQGAIAAPPRQQSAAASPPAAGIPPPKAIAMLRQNSSAKMRAHFDEVFGPGAASRAMRLN